VAAVDQKGADYILDNPDLAVVAQDDDALRRLFETRTKWPGARHARLAVANVLSGDIDDAYRHERAAEEWIIHKLNKPGGEHDFDRVGPEPLDHAAVPFFLISQRQPARAIRYMGVWRDWYGFGLCEKCFGLIRLAERLSGAEELADLDGFLNALTTQIGCIAAALSFLELPNAKRSGLVTKLAKACVRATTLQLADRFSTHKPYELQDGLRKAAAIAVSLGLHKEATQISMRAPHGRPGVWSMQDRHSTGHVFPFLFQTALHAAAKGTAIHERDVLPTELATLCKGLSKSISGVDFQTKLKAKLDKHTKKQRKDEDAQDQRISTELKTEAERFIDKRLAPILDLTRAFAKLLAAPHRKADRPFLDLVKVWGQVRTLKEDYSTPAFNHFFRFLGSEMATFALWARSDLKASSVRTFLQRLHEEPVDPWVLNRIVAMLALRTDCTISQANRPSRAKHLSTWRTT
jgi:hypothetical protein